MEIPSFSQRTGLGPVRKSYRLMVLRNGISLGIRKNHVKVGNKFDCVERVSVGQRLPSRFVQSGAAREMNLVKIVVEAPAIRRGLPSTSPTQPVFGWCCSRRFGGL